MNHKNKSVKELTDKELKLEIEEMTADDKCPCFEVAAFTAFIIIVTVSSSLILSGYL